MSNSNNDPALSIDAVRTLLEQAAQCSAQKQDEEALRFDRQALKLAMFLFQQQGRAELLHLALIAYRGIAVSAFITGRNEEALIALGTGLTNADVGLKHWPDAPLLREQQQSLQSLEQKVGIKGTAYIADDLSDWPFDD
jgi:hypothetical protein